MFKIIEPKYHCFYKPLIEHFIKLMNSHSSPAYFDEYTWPFLSKPLKPEREQFIESRTYAAPQLSEHERNLSTFILTEDEEKGVCGGALLLKKKSNDFPRELMGTLSSFVTQPEYIWKCHIFISFEKNGYLYKTNEVDSFSQVFYQNLYDRLIEFGRREGVGFLCVSLSSGEYLCTEEVVLWPYIFELKPRNSSDGFFYGILPLIGSQCEAYQKFGKF